MQVGTKRPDQAERDISQHSLVWVWNLLFIVELDLLLVQENCDHLAERRNKIAILTLNNLLALFSKSIEKLLDNWEENISDLGKVWLNDDILHLFSPSLN